MEANVDGRPLPADGTPAHGLRVIGTLLRGTLWECTAVPEIRTMAAKLVRELPNELRHGNGHTTTPQPTKNLPAARNRGFGSEAAQG